MSYIEQSKFLETYSTLFRPWIICQIGRVARMTWITLRKFEQTT